MPRFFQCISLLASVFRLRFLYVLVDKDTLFKESDFVSAHTALTPETAGKIMSD